MASAVDRDTQRPLGKESHPAANGRANGGLGLLSRLSLDCDNGERAWLYGQNRPQIDARLSELAEKPFIRQVAALPDCHWKKNMELPSSVAVDCGDSVVPDATSVAINDCMSLILTDWHQSAIDEKLLSKLFENVNRRAASGRTQMTEYSPTRQELPDILRHGAPAILDRYGLSPELLGAMERGGSLPVGELSEREFARLVPQVLLRHRGFRAEFGLNFGGNHFLEVQCVDEIVQPELARRWNLFPGQVVVMSHLGPGPFTGNLLHLYSRRLKVRLWRRAAYLGLKLPLHVFRGRGSLAARYRAYFSGRRFQGFPLDSEIGQDLYRVIQLGSNYGYAYQVGCYKAVVDSLAETAKQLSLAEPDPRLLWSVSHNHILPEQVDDRQSLVARHNSVRAYSGMPALLAGRNDVDSCLGVGLDGGNSYLRSYDHGIGALLDRAQQAGALPAETGTTSTHYFMRGKNGGRLYTSVKPRKSRQLIERVMGALERQQIIGPVCYLRPLGTMHN